MLIWVSTGVASAFVAATRPRPVKVTVRASPGVAASVAFWDPYPGETDCSVVPVFRSMTCQPVSPAPPFPVSVNSTGVLRRIASALAYCKPFDTDSAAVRIWLFCIHSLKLGMPVAAKIATIATTTIISMRESPCSLLRRFMVSRSRFSEWPNSLGFRTNQPHRLHWYERSLGQLCR